MAWTCRPGRVHETIVKILLNVVTQPLATGVWIVNPRGEVHCIVQDLGFVTWPDSGFDILEQQADDAFQVMLGNRHFHAYAASGAADGLYQDLRRSRLLAPAFQPCFALE